MDLKKTLKNTFTQITIYLWSAPSKFISRMTSIINKFLPWHIILGSPARAEITSLTWLMAFAHYDKAGSTQGHSVQGMAACPLTLLGTELGHHTKITMQMASIFSTSGGVKNVLSKKKKNLIMNCWKLCN